MVGKGETEEEKEKMAEAVKQRWCDKLSALETWDSVEV